MYNSLQDFVNDCILVVYNCLNFHILQSAIRKTFREYAIDLYKLIIEDYYISYLKINYSFNLYGNIEIMEALVASTERPQSAVCRIDYFFRGDKKRPTLRKVLVKTILKTAQTSVLGLFI